MFGAAAGPPVYVLEACARLWRTIFKMSQDLWDCGEPNECDDDEGTVWAGLPVQDHAHDQPAYHCPLSSD